MTAHARFNTRGKRTCAGKPKVKTGCRTCKTRKVKCDEGKPACKRCISTGRTCDGYGIWGGGGNGYGQRSPLPKPQHSSSASPITYTHPSTSLTTRTPPATSVVVSASERDCLEWFKLRTSTKLPGSFTTPFWKSLIFQACTDEPAVLHAVLALSSVHKRGTLIEETAGKRHDVPDEQERFGLQHYSKAIRHLQPKMMTKCTSPVRVTLIACIIFTCMELVHGRCKAASQHIRNGLRLLAVSQTGLKDPAQNKVVLGPCKDSVDDWINITMSRLHVPLELTRDAGHQEWIFLQSTAERTLLATFDSADQGRQYLDDIFNKIFYLSRHARLRGTSGQTVSDERLEYHQELVRNEVEVWSRMFEATSAEFYKRIPLLQIFAFYTMQMHHTMARVMVDVALCPSNEIIYDYHAGTFELLINQCIQFWKRLPELRGTETDTTYGEGVSRAITEIGWISPLYYTALKCRTHRTRLQAINLLGLQPHREGVWDSRIAVGVAKKVMELEEGDFYNDYKIDDLFPGRTESTFLPPLPDIYKVHDVHVELPNSLSGTVAFSCRQMQLDGGWSTFVGEYNPSTDIWIHQRWVEEVFTPPSVSSSPAWDELMI